MLPLHSRPDTTSSSQPGRHALLLLEPTPAPPSRSPPLSPASLHPPPSPSPAYSTSHPHALEVTPLATEVTLPHSANMLAPEAAATPTPRRWPASRGNSPVGGAGRGATHGGLSSSRDRSSTRGWGVQGQEPMSGLGGRTPAAGEATGEQDGADGRHSSRRPTHPSAPGSGPRPRGCQAPFLTEVPDPKVEANQAGPLFPLPFQALVLQPGAMGVYGMCLGVKV
ncbi:hypothetical protein V8C86DRAFT_2845377 [Haematococcus lacustris]